MDVLTCSPDRWSHYIESVARLALLLAMFSSGVTSQACTLRNSSLSRFCKCDFVSVECTDKPDVITSVPLVNGENIIKLNFGRNGITEIKENDFSHSKKITEIDLQDNLISFIHENAFRNQFKLEIINLARNKLTQLDPSGLTFQQLVSLKQLNLESNLISRINKFTFLTMPASVNVVTVNLAQNQIACNCDVWALRNWIQFSTVQSLETKIKIENLMCNKLPFLNAKDSDFGSCNTARDDIFGSEFSCPSCNNQRTNNGCNKQGVRKCNKTQVCQKRLQWNNNNNNMKITSRCSQYEQCLEDEKGNVGCYFDGNKENVVCSFCCRGPTCANNTNIGGRTDDYTIHVSYKRADATYQPDMDSLGSPWFSDEEARLDKGIRTVIHTVKGGVDVYLEKFIKEQDESFRTELRIEVTAISTQKIDDVIREIKSDFMSSFKKGNSFLNKEMVIPESFMVQNITVHCLQSDTNLMDKGSISWSTGNIGPHSLQCPYSSTGDPKMSIATRECYINDDGETEWGTVNDSLCATKYNQTFRVPLSSDNSEIIAGSLEEYIKKTFSNFTEDTLNLVIVRIEEFKNESLLQKTSSVEHLVNGVSKLITAVEGIVTEPENKRNVSRRILAAVDYISEKAPLTDGFMKVVTPNLAVAASGIDNTKLQNLIMIADTDSSSRFTEVNVSFTTGNMTELSNTSTILIPVQAILSSMGPEQRNSQNRVAFVIYRSDTLFNATKDNAFRENSLENMTQNSLSMNNVSQESQDSKNSKVTTKVNSHIIAASIPGFKVHNLSENVFVHFIHNNTNATNPQCVWWDESLSNGLGNWSDVGCSVVLSQDGKTVCSCNHLTSFALLMDVYHSHVTDQNKWILSIISYVGCGISLIGLFLTFLTFTIFRKFRKDNPSKILIHLCLSMMLSNLVFLAGMQDYAFSNDISCKAVAVLLHYFLLASLCWMAVEAFYMYLAIVLVFRTYYHNFILKCSLVGWGVPLVVVIITLAVNSTDNYGSIKSGICWLQDLAFYGAFVGPVCFILLMNFIAFILVLRQIINVTTPKFNKTDRGGAIRRLRAAIGVVILLGLTWIFAIFAHGDASVVFNYLFAVFNSLQGLFIFIFYCLMKKDAMKTWKRALPCFSEYGEASSSSARALIKTGDTKL